MVENAHLTGVEKFHYLAQSLKNEARSVIQNLTNTAENFQVAWSLLCQRYNNPRQLASSYINNLETPPEIKRSHPQSIRNFIDHYMANIKALKALKLTVPTLDLIILHRILAHCPSDIVKEWERHSASSEAPSLESMYDFLEKTYRIEESCQSNPVLNHATSHQTSNQNSNKNDSMQALSCPICKEPHTIFKCQKFKAMNPAERLTHFKTNKLCFNCCKVNVRGHKCSEKT